jgi:hypothetical protein
MAVKSWPLSAPVRGPAFGVAMSGFTRYARASGATARDVRFSSASFLTAGNAGLVLEGYYFPPRMRRFIRIDEGGAHSITNVHPSGIAFDLKVILPEESCALKGFLGLHLYSEEMSLGSGADGFTLNSSAGNVRRNEAGETLADAICAVYPASNLMPVGRDLNWPQLKPPNGNDITKF